MKQGYFVDLERETLENENFRKVLFTAEHMQLVVMTILPGEEIGLETHQEHDQFIRVEEGEGKAIISSEEFTLFDGSAIIIPAGNEHNIINTGNDPLRLYTIYTPVEHPDGTIHKTKEEANEHEHEHHS